jgi:hypothetical protein
LTLWFGHVVAGIGKHNPVDVWGCRSGRSPADRRKEDTAPGTLSALLVHPERIRDP